MNRRTMTSKAGLLLLTLCLLITGAASAGTVYADTEGLIGKVTDTIFVPVVVSGADNIVAWQLEVVTRDDSTAKIIPYAKSVRENNAVSTGKLVYWWEESDDLKTHIHGDKTLFYLAVTPRAEQDISIELKELRVYEDNPANRVDYQLRGTVLTVSGWGDNREVGDEGSGATVRYGLTDENGNYWPGDKTGIIKVTVPGHPKSLVTIFTGQSGLYPVPETLRYLYVDEVYTESEKGEEYTITYAEYQSVLTDLGITADQLFVLHCINGKWYESPVVERKTEDGMVYLTVKTWSHGAFTLGYDKGGVSYPKETRDTVFGKGTGLGFMPVNIVFCLLIISAGILIIVLIRRRKQEE